MERKTFFKERTIPEIKRLNIHPVTRTDKLVERIHQLSPEEGLMIRTWIVPGRFYAGSETGSKASRKCWKHGDFINLDIPQTKESCVKCPDIPLAIRQKALKNLEHAAETDINYIGYSTRANWGDRTKRIFPFTSMLEGAKIFAYAENLSDGIGVDLRYTNSKRARYEGATVPVTVPSRTEKKTRYSFSLTHIPIVRSDFNLSTVLQLKPGLSVQGDGFSQGQTPQELYDMRYTSEEDIEGSNLVRFYPHHVAAYLGIIKETWKEHNMVPIEMNPFAIPSRQQANFYKRIRNNLIVFDPKLSSKEKFRKPSLSETAILLARNIAFMGAEETAYWDPERDGKLRDYNWDYNS